ncbi:MULTISPECIES: glycosyltransferase [unclassified Pseudomonas]|uniref:glycosyltransferase n=1 Tax=unclassified Pseudomonas TaxID=196821 RepID=UPI00244D74E4|nr:MULTISPECIES: glycosyltransferase [unclassified Pseudomonas]MDH0304890.1 glycosyltransferase [Pseudomonas sp. GD04091]MDH1988270.1 glycosyltransferase [Pseudomonas sp. GD03689]
MVQKKKLCIVSTVPGALRLFMREHIRTLCDYYDVTLIANARPEEVVGVHDARVSFIPLGIERKVSLVNDLKALFGLWRIFRQGRFDCVLSIMPKSGLLAMLASFLARVPNRIHIFTGQVWYTSTGISRFGLKVLDRLLAFCATHVMADSPSQRTFLINENVVPGDKITVLGEGSISGVDTDRFKPDPEARKRYRDELGIDSESVIFLYMARVTRDKGVLDLAKAFAQAAPSMPNAYFVLIGPDEEGIEHELSQSLISCMPKVRRIEFTYDPEGYMAASDVFCIPSYREGFSSATIQAAGTGCAAIASRIYGLTDAVVENATGIFHTPGAIAEIADSLQLLYADTSLRGTLGRQAHERAHRQFSQQRIINEMVDFVRRKVN